jgi:hypothetical protein
MSKGEKEYREKMKNEEWCVEYIKWWHHLYLWIVPMYMEINSYNNITLYWKHFGRKAYLMKVEYEL